ncbi:MIR motif-containing protein, partial [Glomus cerebriforme]
MELPKYSGIIHPKEWLKQVQTFCYFKQMSNDQEILNICKLMIDSTIIVPGEINSFNELIKALKSHPTFNIFKNSCNKKLQEMKYTSEQDIAEFLANFRSLCNNVEINNPEEIKILLINSYSNNFFNNEFIKRVDGINFDSIDKIFEIFSDVISDESKIIKYGSSIALKHVATGKYLSSCNTSYQTGSRCQVVFASEKLANSLWNVSCISYYNEKESYQYNTVCYNDTICLMHKATNSVLCLNSYYKSPTTGHTEVNCKNGNRYLKCNSTNNNGPYVKAKDIITLSYDGYTLRSHDFTFTINNKTFQEVVCHKERTGGNDEWQIEIIK